jgi:hypothetical protein
MTTKDTPVWVALGSVPHAIRYVRAAGWRTRVFEAGVEHEQALVLMSGVGGHLEAYAHNIGRSPSTTTSWPTTSRATATREGHRRPGAR